MGRLVKCNATALSTGACADRGRMQLRTHRNLLVARHTLAHLRPCPGHEGVSAHTGSHLPSEQGKVHCVEGNVCIACVVIALLHCRDQGSCQRPKGHDASTSKQVGAREQLAGTEPCVESALYGKEHTTTQQGGTPPVVLVAVAA